MTRPHLSAAAAALVAGIAICPIFLASCTPPPAPPRRFKPNPPYPPEPVDPYNQRPGSSYPDVSPPPDPNIPPPPTVPRPGEYPVARRTANPNEVISPYEPYNVIDVSGFTPGQLARDPHNQKIFRVP